VKFKEKYKPRNRRYAETHRAQINTRARINGNGKRYRERHKDEIRERKEHYRRTHMEQVRIKNREWARLHPDKKRDWDLRRRLGITKLDYDRMFAKQGGVCPLCDRKKRLYTDHNHKTSVVRGLICQRCNLGVAAVEDTEWLKKAMEYLRDPPASRLQRAKSEEKKIQ
jgi:hypothetical protein